MPDPLSVAASAIALFQLSQTIIKYLSSIADAPDERQRLILEISGASGLLVYLNDQVATNTSSALASLTLPSGPLSLLKEALARLEAKLAPSKSSSNALALLKWPFKKKEVLEILDTIERQKVALGLAIQCENKAISALIQKNTSTIQQSIDTLREDTALAQKETHRKAVLKWLSTTEISSSHQAALSKRQVGTCSWILNDAQYGRWKGVTPDVPLLWLHGIPGCGKTVLCSTIVEDLIVHCSADKSKNIAYFYFDFKDMQKYTFKPFLRSMMRQIGEDSKELHPELQVLYQDSQEGNQEPSVDSLLRSFRLMLENYSGQLYVVIDALDECMEQENLTTFLEEMRSWNTAGMKILCLSRRLRDIEDTMQTLSAAQISIQGAKLRSDIQLLIQNQLSKERRLRKWPQSVRDEIEHVLLERAGGMFRWVACQLDTLNKCLKIKSLRTTLKSLPRTLEETYARILAAIEPEHIDDTTRILQYLVCSARPLQLQEIADVVAIDVAGEAPFDPDQRLLEPMDLTTICSSLVNISPATIQVRGLVAETLEFHLAHFSVKEYLLSNSIRQSTERRFAVVECEAHAAISETCLAYLVYCLDREQIDPSTLRDFPLLKYAARYWVHHLNASGSYTHLPNVDRLLSMLLHIRGERRRFEHWIRIWNPDDPSAEPDLSKDPASIAPPLYYLAMCGCQRGVSFLLADAETDVNALGGNLGTALHAASWNGHAEIVTSLLDMGADAGICAGRCGYAISAALFRGHQGIFETLARRLPNLEVSDQNGRTAVSWCAEGGSVGCLSSVLAYGADIESRAKNGRTPLLWAATEGHEAAVTFLLDHGADIESQDLDQYTAVCRAAKFGHASVVSRLIERGVKLDTRDKQGQSALIWAAKRGHNAVVESLVGAGADTETKDHRANTALMWAKKRGFPATERLLLSLGAKPEPLDAWWGHSLWKEARERLPDYETMLELSRVEGFGKLVLALLGCGAQIDARASANGFTVLIWAAEAGHDTVVQHLLDDGRVSLEAVCAEGNDALHYAAKRGYASIVQKLVNSGANADAKDPFWGQTPLTWATKRNHYDVVTVLLRAGTEIDARDKEGQTALIWAAKRGYEKLVRLLILNKADVSVVTTRGESALFWATKGGHDEVVKLLSETISRQDH